MSELAQFSVNRMSLMVLAVLLGGVLTGHLTLGDDRTRLQATAAAAIAIHNINRDRPAPPGTVSTSPPMTKSDHQPPVVTMYSATWCIPCQQAKAELQRAKLPFALHIIDVSQGGQPGWCESIPAFAWPSRGRTLYVTPFPGVEQLVRRWQATQ